MPLVLCLIYAKQVINSTWILGSYHRVVTLVECMQLSWSIDNFWCSFTLEQRINKIKKSSASKAGFYLQVMHLPWTTTYFKRWIFGAKLSDLAFYVIVPWFLFFQCVVNLWYWNPILFLNVSPKWALPGDASLQIFLHTHIYLSFYFLSLSPSLSQFSNPENSFPKCLY